MISRYLAIVYTSEHGNAKLLGPALVAVNDSKPGWYYCAETGECLRRTRGEVVVLRAYHSCKTQDEAVLLRFLRDFPPVSLPLSQSAGWLSPSGEWFPCRGFEHEARSRHLVALNYNHINGTPDYLEERGWLHIDAHGLVRVDINVRYTQRQIDALFDLTMIADGSYKRYVKQSLDLLLALTVG